MKPNIWVSSAQASELLIKQLAVWPLAKKKYQDLQAIQIKQVDMGGFIIEVQFNPARITSTNADMSATRERKCFLCAKNLPIEQIRLPFGYDYYVLCNPYPIFKEHFTIPSKLHEVQEIKTRMPDMLELAYRMNKHTIFYNGPHSGASAPDHAHFQAVTSMQMPIEKEIDLHLSKHGNVILDFDKNRIYMFINYLRNGFLIESKNQVIALILFNIVYDKLCKDRETDTEPGMNIFCKYRNGMWKLIIIPRKKHRPEHFYAVGEDQFLSSPGAADMGGLFITPRVEDFNKADASIIRDIYKQVCYSDEKIIKIAELIERESKSGNIL